MGPSTSTSSSSSYCPYDWRVKVEDYVRIKLTPGNYPDWKQAMLDFIEMQGMEEFLIYPPLLTSEDKIDDGPDSKSWKRSDRLLRRWILETLSSTLELDSGCKTAGVVWQELEYNYYNKLLRDEKAKKVLELKPDKKDEELEPYRPLLEAIRNGGWEKAHIILRDNPEFKTAQITWMSKTALMVAIQSREDEFVRKMVEIMSADEVLQTDRDGLTALHVAAMTGNLEAVKLLQSKNTELLNICSEGGYPPLYFAALDTLFVPLYRKRQVVDYLFPRTPEDSRKGNVGNEVAVCLIDAGFYDVALNWIRGPPEWKCNFVSLFEELVSKLSSSSSESKKELNFWQSLIYRFIKINHKKNGDIEIVEDHQVSVLQIGDVEKKKVMNSYAEELLQHLCSKTAALYPEKFMRVLEDSIQDAVRTGMYGLVEEIIASYPEAMFVPYGEMRQTILHRVVIHRWEKVFKILCKIHKGSYSQLGLEDKEGNTVLHLVANLTSEGLTNLEREVVIPALQLQRELQWFKEVLILLSAVDVNKRNYQGRTAFQLFTESHKELLKEGEAWMKTTANSCSVVAALIVTIVFAAAITVPGGNNSTNGNPILFYDLAFKIFAISEGFAFFSSSFSVIMFLSILTSRFTVGDFLKSVTKRLIFGFISLFLSIISMMAAFSVTVYLFLGQKKTWILALVTALGILPVASFAFLQFPLLWKLFKSTSFPYVSKIKAKFFYNC